MRTKQSKGYFSERSKLLMKLIIPRTTFNFILCFRADLINFALIKAEKTFLQVPTILRHDVCNLVLWKILERTDCDDYELVVHNLYSRFVSRFWLIFEYFILLLQSPIKFNILSCVSAISNWSKCYSNCMWIK